MALNDFIDDFLENLKNINLIKAKSNPKAAKQKENNKKEFVSDIGFSSSIKATKPIKNVDWFTRVQLSVKARMKIYEKIGKFTENGVPLLYALEQIYIHSSMDGKKTKAVAAIAVNHWIKLIRNGSSFSQALDGWAPIDEISILNSGEISGKLHKSIENVMFLYEAKKKIRGALGGLAYPVMLLACTCFFMIIFGTQVVPAFEQILPVSEWKGTGRTMAILASFVQNDLLPIIICLLIVLVIIISTLPYWCGRLRSKFDSFPPWTIYRITIGSGFLISLAALLDAGVAAPDALLIISKTASPWYRERLLYTRLCLLNGAVNIGDALYKSELNFPSQEMIIDIRSYASLDGFEEMLDKLSHQWQEDAVVQIESQMAILRNVAIVIMGLVFMWIVSGMFALEQQISNAAAASM